ncbi:FMN-dependent NADH-azoreductase [Microbulbifer sp. CnH-101-E]|uniref:FMN-dependent NADH-azoreductase n=1 Tax=unclassified Microbulbifer TaxID=2619833 RepID=UPI004039D732
MSHKILAVYASALGDHSTSRSLAKHWLSRQAATEVTELDLSLNPVPHLSGEMVSAFFTPEEQKSAAQKALTEYSNNLIEQVKNVDTVLIAAPMYNFGSPSTLKAWFDHLARAGVTFTYTENGPEGLIRDTKVVLVTTSGGFYKDSVIDFHVPYIKHFLSFIGIDDVTVIYAEGLNMGDDHKETALTQAKVALEAI